MTKKSGWLGERFCLLCALAFCGLIVLQSARRALSSVTAICVGGAALALLVCLLTARAWKLNGTKTALSMFILRAALALFMVWLVDAVPVQDFATMYHAAQELAQGGRGYLDNIYFFNWAYQTGFVAYESILLSIFGPGQLSLQVMNALWMGGIGALVSLIAYRLLPSRAAACVSVLFALYPAPYFLAAVLTNQHIAAFFFYLAVWLLIREDRLTLSACLLAGLSIALGNVMRPIGVVLLLAIGCWRVFRLLLREGRDWTGELLRLAGVVGSYFLVFSLISTLIVSSGLNPQGLTNNQPMWKFVLGFNQESSGSWNRSDYENYLMLPTEEADAAMREVVLERLAAPPADLAKLAVRKSAVMWGAEEDLFWGFGHLEPSAEAGPFTVGQWTRLLAAGDKGVCIAAFALAALGVLTLLLRGTHGGNGSLLLAFLLCGYYAVHLIVEVQSRYRYFLMPTVFLLGGYALAVICKQRR